MRMNTIICLSCSMALILGGVLGIPELTFAAAKQTHTAAYVKEAPALLDDTAWQKASAVEIPFEGKEKFARRKASVTTKALYTEDGIFFLFKWKDGEGLRPSKGS